MIIIRASPQAAMSSSRRHKKRKITQSVETSAPVYPSAEGWLAFKAALLADQDHPYACPVEQGNPITSAKLAALAGTSRKLNALFQPILRERSAAKLHHAIAFGDENLAMRI